MRQTLVLENFPRVVTARALSPNGRAHWRTRDAHRKTVHDLVAVRAREQGLQPMHGSVVMWPHFVYPIHRARDDDNLATGVVKSCRDALVRGGWLEADDMSTLRQLPATVAIEKGRRGLTLVFTDESMEGTE